MNRHTNKVPSEDWEELVARRQLNAEDSTEGICNCCGEPITTCECDDIHCPVCEDGMPRRHACVEDSEVCEYCGEPLEDCNCHNRDQD
jgi:hypothetical protein